MSRQVNHSQKQYHTAIRMRIAVILQNIKCLIGLLVRISEKSRKDDEFILRFSESESRRKVGFSGHEWIKSSCRRQEVRKGYIFPEFGAD
jgi:hypothetical protein